MSKTEAGFSLNEMMIVAAITMLTVGIAAPTITSAIRQYELSTGVQTVATAVRNARYQAVTKNVRLRVRFNCPAANQMRVVEVTGNPAIDNAADRCNTNAYPYPAPDLDPATLPNNDGPVLSMSQNMTFGLTNDLDISTMGRIQPLTGCPPCANTAPPATIGIGDTYVEKRLTVSGSGQVTVSQSRYGR